MRANDATSVEEPPPILKTLWRNWQQAGGGHGRCHGCPAHWSTRADISGEPGERTTSFQHRPFCGDGSFDPDIAIVAREPGTPRQDKLDRNRRDDSLEDIRNESITNSPGGTIKQAMPLFEQIEASEFAGCFTQIRKCNELQTGDNTQARRQCAGTTENYQGYLYDELEALDPEYVITITTEGQAEFCEVFDLPQINTKEMASGPTESGFRTIEQESLGFTWFPAPHPSPRGASQVYNRLDADLDPKGYFELFANDVLAYIRGN